MKEINGQVKKCERASLVEQVAVGNYILQIGDVNGGVVNVAPPTAQLVIEPRARAVNMKPRPFPSMLDRAEETASIKSALETYAPMSTFGMGGKGKTSTLCRSCGGCVSGACKAVVIGI